jgi:hypothetical protein
MMRDENANASLTVRDGAPIAVDGINGGGVLRRVVASQGADEIVGLSSRVGDRVRLAVPNNTVEFFSKLGRLVRQVLRAVLFPAGPSMLGTLSTYNKQRRAAFDPAPLARGERKPRQSIQGPIG